MNPEEKAKDIQKKMKPEDKQLVQEVMKEKDPKEREKLYNQYVKKAGLPDRRADLRYRSGFSGSVSVSRL